MSNQTVTINLPDALYEQLKQRANLSQSTIEAELLQMVSAIIPVAGKLTPDLRGQLAQMQFLDDKALWQAARTRLSKRSLSQLQSLNYKRQREGLTEAETQKSNTLLQQYERIILLRAQAAQLLKERGHDLSEFETD